MEKRPTTWLTAPSLVCVQRVCVVITYNVGNYPWPSAWGAVGECVWSTSYTNVSAASIDFSEVSNIAAF